MSHLPYFVHKTAEVEAGAVVGEGTKIWHFCHVMSGAEVGRNCVLGQNVFVASGARIGNHVRIQNNVSVYDGVILEDNVFCGPSAVFTNVTYPRAHVNRRATFATTRVQCGATIGANATVLCGGILEEYCFIAAGAVVKNAPAYALMVGVPARPSGWMCRCGEKIAGKNVELGTLHLCTACGLQYRKERHGMVIV